MSLGTRNPGGGLAVKARMEGDPGTRGALKTVYPQADRSQAPMVCAPDAGGYP
jgi:hypothetical protein